MKRHARRAPTALRILLFGSIALGAWLLAAAPAFAQGGPPLVTNDPGTPGPKNWEINLGVMQVLRHNTDEVQVPQIDLNYGVGDRIQLTYEVPFVWQSSTSQPNATGWSNGYPGVKWRFLDRGEDGWNMSTFPQVEIAGPRDSSKTGIADAGTRFLLPIEVTHPLGPLHVDFEVGYYFPVRSPQTRNERILGLAMGHTFSKKFEAIGEVYNDEVMGGEPHDTYFDGGGRYQFHKGLLLLFMAGRSFSGNSSGQPNFIGYVGLQILLERNGRALQSSD
jgi:Putative MetA-pathway of phenol degradation